MTYPNTKTRRKSRHPLSMGKEKWLDLERHAFRAREGKWKHRRRHELS